MSRLILVVGFLAVVIVVFAGSTINAALPQANAYGPNQQGVRCGLKVTPPWDYVAQGGTGSFDVSVFCSAGNPQVELIYSPPTIGITVSFSVNKQATPYSSTMTVKVDASKLPGNYTVEIWAHPVGTPFPGPLDTYQNVFVIVVPPPTATAVAQTDWELTNAYAVPTNPTLGATVTFAATLRAVSTTTSFPQTVRIEILGQNIMGTFNVIYNGPVGSTMTITIAKTLNVPAGKYTVYLYADPPLPFQYNDPNRANNGASVTFTVGTGTTTVTEATTNTSSSYSVTAWSLTSTSQPVTTVTMVATQSGFWEMFQENMGISGPYSDMILLLLGVAVVVVIIAVLRRKSKDSKEVRNDSVMMKSGA